MTERLLTILFTDVEGSTALRSARGDVEAQEILRACDELIRQHVQAHGGQPIKSLGDGLMVSFDSPRRALACALEVQAALSERAHRQPRDEVRVRLGLHTGDVAEEAGDLFGQAVNAAARIAARARGGEVLVSEVVRQLCSGVPDTDFEDRGRQALKGFPDRWRLYRVISTLAPRTNLAGGERTPFVGRTVERAQLRSLMERALGGQGNLVMIGGEPGVGKSRLCQEVTEEGRRLGLRVLVGHCYQREGDLPYMPWVEMIETAIADTAPSALLDSMGDSAPEMARLVPQLRRLFPEMPPPIELPPDQQRRFTFTSITDYVTRMARLHPRLYVLEDLHWADDLTLLLLDHLAQRLATTPVLMIGTYRDLPVEVSPILEQTLAGLVSQRRARVLGLRRHAQPEVDALLRGLSGQSPPPEVVTAIHSETEGNAFFVEEVFRHLTETGRLLDDRGHFRADLRIEEFDVPENVRLVIGQRLDRLSDPTRRMLTLAAVVGRRFDFELLEASGDLEEEVLLDVLDEAGRARVILPDPLSAGAYSFSHELVRQALLARLAPVRRQRLHLRIADTLERLHELELETHAADIAQHLLGAGGAADRLRTVRFLTVAGDRALAAVAFEDALRDYGHALSILAAAEARLRADLLLKVGLAQRSLRRWGETVAAWNDALSTLETLGEIDAVATLCWDFSFQLIWANRFSEALTVAQRGLAVSGNRSMDRARLLAMRATALGEAGQFEQAAADIAEARGLADGLGQKRLLAEVSLGETLYYYLSMQLPQLMAAGQRAVAGLREAGTPWNLSDGLTFLDVAYVFQGRFAESDDLHVELEPLASRIGHLGAQVIARRNRFPKITAQFANLAQLDELSLLQANVAPSMGAHWVAYAQTQRGIVELWRGNWELARRHLEEGVRLATPGFWYGVHHGFLLLLLALSGERDLADRLFAPVAESLPEPGRASTMGSWCLATLAAEAFGVLGDVARARVLHPLVVEDLARGTVIRQYDGGLIRTAAAMAAAAVGRRDESEEHFEAALQQAADLPQVMERPHVRHLYGRFLLERGGSSDRDQGRALLDQAVTGYRMIGMPRHVAMAEAEIAGLV